jgi:hypothetical protein
MFVKREDTSAKTSKQAREQCYKVRLCSRQSRRRRRRRESHAASPPAQNRPPHLTPPPTTTTTTPPDHHHPQARDAFYECLREAGVLPSPGQAPPSRCAAARQAFEKQCLPSWVLYFDEQQLREASRRSAALSQAIRAGQDKAAGGLAGKAQQ